MEVGMGVGGSCWRSRRGGFVGVGGSLYIPISMRIYLPLHIMGLYADMSFVPQADAWSRKYPSEGNCRTGYSLQDLQFQWFCRYTTSV